jgi:hypothetical protein
MEDVYIGLCPKGAKEGDQLYILDLTELLLFTRSNFLYLHAPLTSELPL